MRGYYVPSSRIVFIIIGVLFLLEQVSAYIHGTLCVSGVYFSYETYFEGSIQDVEDYPGLVVYQEGVNLTQVLQPNDLLTTDLDGSVDVTTNFKVGKHTCTLYGQWSSQGGNGPVNQPHVTKITCSHRAWTITSSDTGYTSLIVIGNLNPPNPMDYYGSFYNLYGKYCGSY
ncbi:hypothetical protein V1525DRAFT_67387 [Lipomyces kononenkoae]|uniref:Uncharacterized protein n=1 Tax=Lipomyces kononenkoae TaxID=34357 RepID=A0ACC3SSP4_LIPKO